MKLHTYMGKRVDPFNLKPSQVCIDDIAHSLSLLCRFAGHTPRHYSVAQHSVLVADHLAGLGHSKKVQLYGLLHDATEAYIVDLPSMIKAYMRNYQKLERDVSEQIAKKFKLSKNFAELDVVYLADKAVLKQEIASFFSNKPFVRERIHVVTADTAERMFLNRFEELIDATKA